MDAIGSMQFLTPELLEQLANIGVGEEKLKMLEDQMGRAEALRATATPQGRGYAGVFTAANPLEFASSMYNRYKGGKERDEVQARQEALVEELRRQRQAAMSAIATGGGMTQPAPLPGLGGGGEGY